MVENGVVTVYNDEFPNGFDPDDGQEYSQDITITPGNVDVTVAEGDVFALGDNRTNSQDSRSFGPVPSNSITGVATLRFVPLDAFRTL